SNQPLVLVPIANLLQGPGNVIIDLGIHLERHKDGNRARVLQVTQEVGGIVAVCANLTWEGPPAARNTLARRSCGIVAENGRNHLESSGVSKARENECSISPQVPVFVRQPRLQFGKNTGILPGYHCLSHFELSPEYCGGLELLQQLGNRWALVCLIHVGRGKEQNERTANLNDHR